MFKRLLLHGYKAGHRFFTEKGIRAKPLRVLNSKVIQLLKSNFVELDGYKFFLDSKDSLRLSTRGYFEPYITELMQKEIKKGEVVVDIGANIGYHTLFMAKLVGDKGKVYAFEPHPDNFALLKKNVEVNGYKNVVLEQKAVLDKIGRIKFYQDRDGRTTQHSILKSDYVKEDQSMEVDSVSLDNYFNGKSVDFIKMDIEGAEHYAVLGMSGLLRKNKSIKMILEFTPVHLKRLGIALEEHIRLLRELGFSLFNVNEKEKVLEVFEIEKIPVYITKRYEGSINTNLLCRR